MAISLGKRVAEILNRQITEEFSSSYLYMAMSAVLSDMGLEGCASWMMKQAEEEYRHGMKIFNHMLERGAKVKLLPIAASKQEWRAPLHIFEEMQRHEQKVTSLIHAIYEAAVADKDYSTMSFIQWFIDEQVEEESVATNLLDRLRKMQSSDLGVLMFDEELGKRK
ncbi:MAG: ferritin [Alphaproteobacteria bacterium]|nr:ferritin [Alphaproteobacteria bacterium]